MGSLFYIDLATREDADKIQFPERSPVSEADAALIVEAVNSYASSSAKDAKIAELTEENERLSGAVSSIAIHLDCEHDDDSILHTIREMQADFDIAKEENERLRAEVDRFKSERSYVVGVNDGWEASLRKASTSNEERGKDNG
jgi:hypothetical protein